MDNIIFNSEVREFVVLITMDEWITKCARAVKKVIETHKNGNYFKCM